MSPQETIYQINRRSNDPFAIFTRGIGIFVLLSLLGLWGSTEVTAYQFRFNPALGQPIISHLYYPWGIFDWARAFKQAANPALRSIAQSGYNDWLYSELGSALAMLAIWSYSARRSKRSSLYGSAHWATEEEIKKTGLLDNPSGVYVGAWYKGKNRHILRHDGPEHVLSFAPTRSGKGVGLVIPTLLSWPHSVIVHDIKGENFTLTSGWRNGTLKQRIFKFEPSINDGTCSRFNPLDQIRLRTPHEVQDTQNIVQMLTDPDGNGADGQEAHWITSSSALLVGVILHIMYEDKDTSLGGVSRFLSSNEPQALWRALLKTTYYKNGGSHPVVAMAAQDMLNKDPKEATSVLSTAIRFLTLFRDPIVAANTQVSDFAISDLRIGSEPISLYIVVPPAEIDRLRPLTRLLFSQILRVLTSAPYLDLPGASKKHRVLLMIDELPSLGRLEILQTSLAFMAGYGLKAYLISQDVAQLTAAYGGQSGHDETIMANCHVQIAYAPNKIETMELLSKLIGTTTVRTEFKSYSGSRFGIRNQVAVNAQDNERPLLTPDEVRRLPDTDAIVLVAGHPPIYARKIRYYQETRFLEASQVPPHKTYRGKNER